MFRIAFLTSEFISEKASGGGLGNYLNRITQALKEYGHCPEVFVVSSAEPSVITFEGVRVERVPLTRNIPLKIIDKLSLRIPAFRHAIWGGPSAYLAWAFSLAQAFQKRHSEKPFDFVQSTNCHATGLFVPNLINCPHLVRLSSKRDLWFSLDGQTGIGAEGIIQLEKACVRRANIAYAPSKYIADQCRKDGWRQDIHVVRPPIFIDTDPAPHPPVPLPERYFLHFGQFGERKGSFALARALCKVWIAEPNFKMVWAGRPINKGDYEYCHQLWKEHAANVIWLGSLRKAELYATLQGAEVTVLPSIADNLPNTVIESLLFKIPVIGFLGGSIDEIVVSGTNGELVTLGDEEALAKALLKAWRKEFSWMQSQVPMSPIFQEFHSQYAVSSLLKLAFRGKENDF